MPTLPVEDLIRQEADRAGVPPELALAVAEQESGFNPTKRGAAGEWGVMQLMPGTAKMYGQNPEDPLQNIRGGVMHLRRLLDTYQGDLPKVLGAYNAGEGRVNAGAIPTSTQAYIPGVLGKIPRYRTQPPPQPAAAQSQVATPPPGFFERMLNAIDPRTPEGRVNIGGAVGALGLSAVMPEATLAITGMKLLTPLTGAYLGGAAEHGAEALVGTAPPGSQPGIAGMQEAGGQQMANEALGRGLTALIRWPLRGLVGSSIGRQVPKVINQALTDASEAWDRTMAGSPRARGVGQEVEAVAQGPARSHLRELGARVRETAQSGPEVDISATQQKIAEMGKKTKTSFELEREAAENQPAARNPEYQTALENTLKQAKEQVKAGVPGAENYLKVLKEAGVELEPSHPLPGVLGDIQQAPSKMSMEDAQILKERFDQAIPSWDHPARKTIDQMTKGARIALREDLRAADHAPYEEANAAYEKAHDLFEGKSKIRQLHSVAKSDPESLVREFSGRQPTKLAMLKEVLTSFAEKGKWPSGLSGKLAGESAWNNFRSAWTHKNLLQPGIARLDESLAKVDPDFLATMYGDQEGQAVLGNLKTISAAYEQATEQGKAFAESSVQKGRSAMETASAVVHGASAIAHPGSIPWAARHAAHTFSKGGLKNADILQWASLSSQRTQWLVNVILHPELTGLPHLVGSHVLGKRQDQEQLATPPPTR